jgi:hypothetical protein
MRAHLRHVDELLSFALGALGRQELSLKHYKFLIYERRVCRKQDRRRLGFYEVGREEAQEKRKILEENAQAAQEEKAR